MIHLGYLGEVRNISNLENSSLYLIVRKPVSGIPKGFTHLPQMSPSMGLFKDTYRWKKHQFTESEKRRLEELSINKDDAFTWWELYKPRFIKEMKNQDFKKAIDFLVRDMQEGRDSWLLCYCKDAEHCHRILVGKYLEDMGFEVDYRYKRESVSQLSFLKDK